MKNKFILMVLGVALSTGIALATPIQDPWRTGAREQNVYNIYNSLYGTSYTSSSEIPQFSSDGLFYATQINPQVQFILSQASLTQNFGYYRIGEDGSLEMNSVFSAPPAQPGTFFDLWNDGTSTNDPLGFFNVLKNNTWYSEEFRNADGMDHVIALMTPQEDTILFVFEDMSWSGDRDYNDLIVEVRGIIPEPSSFLLISLPLLLFGVGGSIKRRL